MKRRILLASGTIITTTLLCLLALQHGEINKCKVRKKHWAEAQDAIKLVKDELGWKRPQVKDMTDYEHERVYYVTGDSDICLVIADDTGLRINNGLCYTAVGI